MNKRDQAIQELKMSFKKILKFADEIKFNNLVLEDGTQITIEGQDIAVGIKVMQLDDQGNQTPLNEDTYTLHDGRSFTVGSDGAITEVMGPDDSDDEATSGEETDNVETSKMTKDGLPAGHDGDPKTGEDVTPDTQEDGDVGSRIEDLEKQVAEIVNFLQQLQNSQQEVNEQMMHKIKRIGSESDVEPIIKTSNGYEAYKSDRKLDSKELTNNLLASLKKIKMSKGDLKPATKEAPVKKNFLKEKLKEADEQIRKQEMKKEEEIASAKVPSNQRTLSLLDKIKMKKELQK